MMKRMPLVSVVMLSALVVPAPAIAQRCAENRPWADPATTAGQGQIGAIQAMASSFGVEVTPINVRDSGEIERAITAFVRSSRDGLIVTGSALTIFHRDLIVMLASLQCTTSVSSFRRAG